MKNRMHFIYVFLQIFATHNKYVSIQTNISYLFAFLYEYSYKTIDYVSKRNTMYCSYAFYCEKSLYCQIRINMKNRLHFIYAFLQILVTHNKYVLIQINVCYFFAFLHEYSYKTIYYVSKRNIIVSYRQALGVSTCHTQTVNYLLRKPHILSGSGVIIQKVIYLSYIR